MADFWKTKAEFFRDFEKAMKGKGGASTSNDEVVSNERARKIEAYLRDIQRMSQKDTELSEKFQEAWNKSQEKRNTDEERAKKDRLAAQSENKVFNGNLRAYIGTVTKDARDNLKSGLEVNALTFGKISTKIIGGLGLFGKFSHEPMLKFFDNYKEFTKKRTEEQQQVKMLDALYDLRYVQGKSSEFIELYLKRQGMSNDKIWSTLDKLKELEEERMFWASPPPKEEEKPKKDEQTILKPGTPAGDAFDKAKKFNPNEPQQINWGKVAEEEQKDLLKKKPESLEPKYDAAILKETYVELVNQGKQLDAILLASQEFNSMFAEWTDEWNDENKKKKESKEEGGDGSFLDNMLGDMFGQMLAPHITKFLASIGPLLLKAIPIVGIAGLIGTALMGAAKLASDWLKSKKTPEELAQDDKFVAESNALSSEMGYDGEGAMIPSVSDEWVEKRVKEYEKEREEKKKKDELSLGKAKDNEKEIKKAEQERVKVIEEKKSKKEIKNETIPTPTSVGGPTTGRVEIHNHLNKDVSSMINGRELSRLPTG